MNRKLSSSYKTVPCFRSCAMGTTATAEMLLLLLALVFAAAVRTSEPQQKDEDGVVGRRMELSCIRSLRGDEIKIAMYA